MITAAEIRFVAAASVVGLAIHMATIGQWGVTGVILAIGAGYHWAQFIERGGW